MPMKSFKIIYSNDGNINHKYFAFKDSTDIEDIAWECKSWTERHQLILIDIQPNGKTKVPTEQLASLQGHARRFLPTSDI